jgi:hypothetical protein
MAPKLSVVRPPTTGSQPPGKLGKAGMKLWREMQRHVEDYAGQQMLYEACSAVDLAEELTAQINRDGTLIQIRGGYRTHPNVREVIQARALICRILGRITGKGASSPGRPGNPISGGISWRQLEDSR